MKHWSVQSKVIALAFLPTLIISILLGSYFIIERIYHIDERLNRLGNSMISLLSPAAKYGLLSKNNQILQGLTNSTLENPQIIAAAIFNSEGNLVAYSGPDNLMPQNLQFYKNQAKKYDTSEINFLQPLAMQQITLNDYSPPKLKKDLIIGKNLGWISLTLSNTVTNYIKAQTILVTLIIIILGLIISLLTIRIMLQLINRPLLRINHSLKQLLNNNFNLKLPQLTGIEFERISSNLLKLKQKLELIDKSHTESVLQETNDLKHTLEEIEIQNIELNIALKSAQRDNRLKSEFIASLSHEIRTPMSSIIGFTNLLLESGVSKYQKEYLITIQKSASTLLAIINDILDFSKIEAGKFKLDNVPFDFADIIDEVLQSLAPEAQRKSLELIPFISNQIPAKVIGDPLRLKQIITNLVYNAIKFTDEGSVHVKVDLISKNKENLNIQLNVTDTGIGLSEKAKKNLFKAFSQADISIARKFGGTGLGLVISKQLIEQMGGSIEIHSKSGIGTTIRFNLNLYALTDSDLSKITLKPIPQTVLIYEPYTLSRQAIKESLEPLIQKIILVDTLKKAKEHLDITSVNNRPNQIILSLANSELQNVFSAELLRYIKTKFSLPIIVLINTTNEMIINDLMGYGADNCVIKPISTKKLLAAITQTKTSPINNDSTLSNLTCAPINQKNYKILVAEDNPANLKLITSILKSIGINAITASDGKIAFNFAKHEKFDVIFLDLNMPNMGGAATAEAIRTQENLNKDTPIIAISAFIASEDKEFLLSKGFNELLIKPVDSQTLDQIISKWLNIPEPSNICHQFQELNQLGICQKKSENLPLDLEKTILLAGGNKQVAFEIVQLFVDELPALKQNLCEYYQSNNWLKLRETVHKINGSSRFCVMENLQKVADKFEECLHQQKIENFLYYFEMINQEIVKVETYIRNELGIFQEVKTQ